MSVLVRGFCKGASTLLFHLARGGNKCAKDKRFRNLSLQVWNHFHPSRHSRKSKYGCCVCFLLLLPMQRGQWLTPTRETAASPPPPPAARLRDLVQWSTLSCRARGREGSALLCVRRTRATQTHTWLDCSRVYRDRRTRTTEEGGALSLKYCTRLK